jgi:hypothetical protein
VIGSTAVLGNRLLMREFKKVVISERGKGHVVHGTVLDGSRMLRDSHFLNEDLKKLVYELLKEARKRPEKASQYVSITEEEFSSLALERLRTGEIRLPEDLVISRDHGVVTLSEELAEEVWRVLSKDMLSQSLSELSKIIDNLQLDLLKRIPVQLDLLKKIADGSDVLATKISQPKPITLRFALLQEDSFRAMVDMRDKDKPVIFLSRSVFGKFLKPTILHETLHAVSAKFFFPVSEYPAELYEGLVHALTALLLKKMDGQAYSEWEPVMNFFGERHDFKHIAGFSQWLKLAKIVGVEELFNFCVAEDRVRAERSLGRVLQVHGVTEAIAERIVKPKDARDFTTSVDALTKEMG